MLPWTYRRLPLISSHEPNTTSWNISIHRSNDIDENNNARFVVNGKQILIRGGGWAPDLLQRMSVQRHTRMLRLSKDLGMNAIRLEGKLQVRTIYYSTRIVSYSIQRVCTYAMPCR